MHVYTFDFIADKTQIVDKNAFGRPEIPVAVSEVFGRICSAIGTALVTICPLQNPAGRKLKWICFTMILLPIHNFDT